MHSAFRSAFGVFLGVTCVLVSRTGTVRAAESAESTFDIVRYKAPAGWKVSDQGTSARVFTAPDKSASEEAVVLLLVLPQQEKLDLRAALDGVARQMTQNGKIVQPGEVTSSKTRQGFDALSQKFTAETAGGQRLLVQIAAVDVHHRMAAVCYIASSAAIFDKHMAELEDLLKSVSFNSGAGGSDTELATLDKEKQVLLARLSEIDARQRQLTAPVAGAAKAVTGVPIGNEAPRLAVATADFAKGVDHRRKPHTILGDVLTLDGKPIPNVATASVSVGGITVAAERANYTIEVDKNGHFELKVPDGLYKLSATCEVTVNGHRFPVDLVPIDGRKIGADQSSADGIVKDFRLVISALKPESDPNNADAYLGGLVSVTDPTYTPTKGAISHRHPGAKIRLTFTPLTPAVDGAKLDAFSVDLDATRVGGGEKIRRVPLAGYRVAAALVLPDGSAQALSCSTTYDRNYASAAELNWDLVPGYLLQRRDPTVYVRD